jgi:hypothetical protein
MHWAYGVCRTTRMVLTSPTIVFDLAFDLAGNLDGTGGFPETAFGGTEGSAIRWDGRGS